MGRRLGRGCGPAAAPAPAPEQGPAVRPQVSRPRLQFDLAHSINLASTVVVREGFPTVNLLDGGATGSLAVGNVFNQR